ncbi:hypothetical protein CERSUDRAFT_74669 [Gelatoporia subvermispora B]|uniref:F-box domain-containing protein n=1 Tax=Ceriporiopsis subvermispora (strain B) TaxID=914234 RepID=M2QUV0_CERS8|nr:hypothetical protein CERSUDRAFT_74669 [Gelatoporia subvermispora B]
MHQCLQTYDTLWPILRHSDDRTLPAVARTCHALSDLALDILWENQTSLLNLLRCFPIDILTLVDGKRLDFTRNLLPNDWERFQRHASRIKSLELTISSHIPHVGFRALQALAMCRISMPILPSLRTLDVLTPSDYNEGDAFGLCVLLGPTLQKLVLRFSVPSRDFIAFVPQFSPNLLHIELLHGLDMLNPRICRMLSACRHLRHITVPIDSVRQLDAAFGWLSCSNNWTSINLDVNTSVPLSGLTHGFLHLSALEELRMSGQASAPASIVPRLSSPSLRHFQACGYANIGHILMRYLNHDTLDALNIRLLRAVTFEDLRHLYRFHKLTSLTLDLLCMLSDSNLQAMITTWPSSQILHILCSVLLRRLAETYKISASRSMHDVYQIQSVGRGASDPGPEDTQDHPLPKFTPSEVAILLYYVLPDWTNFDGIRGDIQESSERDKSSETVRRWHEAWTALKALRIVRRRERELQLMGAEP